MAIFMRDGRYVASIQFLYNWNVFYLQSPLL